MPIDIHLAAVTFSDGTQVALPSAAVTFIVGANDSGKSQCLADIQAGLSAGTTGTVVREITRGGGADGPAILNWLNEVANVRRDQAGQPLQWSLPPLGQLERHTVESLASRISPSGPLFEAASLLVQKVGAADRQSVVGGQGSYDPITSQPASPLQVLQGDPELEAEFALAADVAFGHPVTLNRVAGPSLHLHIGRPVLPLDLSADYAREIAELPRVETQGDGYRAYLGLVLSVIVSRAPILLIDEPEMFLHPPQARKLGRELASKTRAGTQVICATHSSDVIEGALQSGHDVAVVRITRAGDINVPTSLDVETLRELWADPLLRYSGALDALFANGLVICENERDCTFYLAVLEEDEGSPGDHDLEFVTVGGKGAIPRVAAAMTALGIPVSAICDIDVLNDEALLDRILTSLGSSLDEEMKRDLRILGSAVVGLATTPTVDDIKEDIVEALASNDGGAVTRETWKKLQAIARRPTGWQRLKQDGLSPLRGDQREAADRLIASLQAKRLHVVPVGELEGWVPEAGGKGPDWLARALQSGGHRKREVQEFVRPLAAP